MIYSAFQTLCWTASLIQPTQIAPQSEKTVTNDSGLTCQQIVKMKLEAFSETYAAKHPHAKKRTARAIYAQCKRQDNDVRAAKLPGQTPGLISSLQTSLKDMQTSAFRMANARSTKEELWLNFEASSAAEREDACGKVIGELVKPIRLNADSRAKSAGTMKAAAQVIPNLEAHKNGFDSKFEWSRYNNGLEKWKTSTVELSKLMGRLPDEATRIVTDLVEESLDILRSVK